LLRPPRYFGSPAQYDIRFEREQFSRLSAVALGIALAPTIVDPHVTTDGPAKFLQPLNKRRKPRLGFRIVGSHIHEHADTPHPLGLLGAGREWPRRRAAEQRDELAPPHHSMTSSARASSVGGMARPSALAVLRLIISSYLDACSTGRSAGLTPFRILSM